MQLKTVETACRIQIKLFQSNKAARSPRPPVPRVVRHSVVWDGGDTGEGLLGTNPWVVMLGTGM